MSRVLIIGYGNPLRRDDGFGWYVAAQLEATWASPEVELITCQQLTPELAQPLSWADYAIFVDAAQGSQPGALSVHKIVPSDDGLGTFSHHVSAPALLANSEVLFGTYPLETYVVSVGGVDFGFGEGMSEEVARQLPIAIEAIHKLISGWSSEAQPAASSDSTNLQSPISISGANYA